MKKTNGQASSAHHEVPGDTSKPRHDEEVTMEDNRTLDEIFCGGKYAKISWLTKETGAKLSDVIAAMKDAENDVEKARELLEQRDQVSTPEKRRAERARKIEELEKEWKPGWWQFYQEKIAEVDARIAKLKEEQERDV